jgi:hypothetical protein
MPMEQAVQIMEEDRLKMIPGQVTPFQFLTRKFIIKFRKDIIFSG